MQRLHNPICICICSHQLVAIVDVLQQGWIQLTKINESGDIEIVTNCVMRSHQGLTTKICESQYWVNVSLLNERQ